jgi:hypothetical protein
MRESRVAEWFCGVFSQTVEFLSLALAVRCKALFWRRRALSSVTPELLRLLNSCDSRLRRSDLGDNKLYVRV